MRSITIHVSDEVANRLAAEASLRKVSIEELATERVSSELPRRQSGRGQSANRVRVDYVQLAEEASRAPSARKSIAEIDADVEAARDEW